MWIDLELLISMPDIRSLCRSVFLVRDSKSCVRSVSEICKLANLRFKMLSGLGKSMNFVRVAMESLPSSLFDKLIVGQERSNRSPWL